MFRVKSVNPFGDALSSGYEKVQDKETTINFLKLMLKRVISNILLIILRHKHSCLKRKRTISHIRINVLINQDKGAITLFFNVLYVDDLTPILS